MSVRLIGGHKKLDGFANQIASVVPSLISSTAATDVVVTFSSDQAGNGALVLGGTQVVTNPVTATAGQTLTIPGAVVKSHVIEGKNRLRVEVTDAAGLVGYVVGTAGAA